ncbi:MAG: hypothetical protein JNK58_12280 [Phycisphaerae bacterium]|nr:hypothetical protein [Phycisphaerae bacterium]
MNRDTTIQLVALLVLVLAMASSAMLSTASIAESGRAQLTYTDEATEGDPPEVAIGIAMGAFRGLFVNYLWIRANKLKEEGKFYEAIELASVITKLQPRFPRVWGFHAWNMAYNISVSTNTAAERWQWVKAGIDLLRKEAIPRNPSDVVLHRELAWTFVHKVQGYADDANHYYKREIAKEWTVLLGEPPKLDGTRDQNTRTMELWFEPVATAPETLDGVIEVELADQAARKVPPGPDGQPVSKVRELADRIVKEAKLGLDVNLLHFVELRRAWINAWYIAEKGYTNELKDSDRNEALDRLMADESYGDAWPRLLNYVRKRAIIETTGMEPARMLRYIRRFGPIDWRHPASHSLYWAARGVEEGLERQGTTQFDTLNTDRIMMHSIQELFRFGTINYDLLTNEYFALNNFDWIDAYGDRLDEVMKRAGIVGDTEQRVYTTYGAGYENFLKDVIRVLYRRGDLANAEKYHSRLRNWTGLNINDAANLEKMKLPLAEFVKEELKDRLSTPHVALEEMESAITDAFLRGLGQRKLDVFRRQMEYAEDIRNLYLQTQSTRTTADAEAVRMKQFVGEYFIDPVSEVLLRLLGGGNFGYYNLGPTQASLLYRRTPEDLQRIIYDDLVNLLQRRQGLPPEAIAEMFPEPSGLAQYREEMAKMESASDRARRRQIEFMRDRNKKE